MFLDWTNKLYNHVPVLAKSIKILSVISVLAAAIFSLPVSAQTTNASASALLSQQQANLKGAFSTGDNTAACINILSGREKNAALTGTTNYLEWSKIFVIGYWIPVVPEECVVCKDGAIKDPITTPKCPYLVGQSVPLPLNLIPQIIIRLYGLLASITIYALALVFSIIGVRYLIGGLSKGGRYTDTAKNLRDVFSALIITLTISTLFLQILYGVLRVDQSQFKIDIVCIPPQVILQASASAEQKCGTCPAGTRYEVFSEGSKKGARECVRI